MSAANLVLPGRLAELLEGQPAAARLVAAALAAPRHAYLFAGPPGSGTDEVARELAAVLIDPDDGDAARRVRAGVHPDAAEMAPAGVEFRKDEIDAVRADQALRPFEAARRVYVLHGVERMNETAANRFLKDLEEPPPYVHLLLVTHRPGALLPTIASRCAPITFRSRSAHSLERELLAEGAEPGVARDASRLSGGAIGRARALATPAGRRTVDAAIAAVCRPAPPGRAVESVLVHVGEIQDRAAERIAAERDRELERAEAMGADSRSRRAIERRAEDAAKRERRRVEADAVDQVLGVWAAWFADLAATAAGAAEAARFAGRMPELARQCDPASLAAYAAAVDRIEGLRLDLLEFVADPRGQLEALLTELPR